MRRLDSLIVVLWMLLSPALARADWDRIRDEAGIKVWQKSVEGTSLVAFRAKGVVKASITHLVAVIQDNEHRPEWQFRCAVAKTIAEPEPGRRINYFVNDSPFALISDRDLVFEGWVDPDVPNKTLYLRFKETKHRQYPPHDDRVRMPRIRGYWALKPLAAGRTHITYEVHADPGGLIPNWVVNMASKELPFKTLQGLRKQVKKRPYTDFIAKLEAEHDWSQLMPRPAGAAASEGERPD